MGITGLLPFIKNSCRPSNLRDFKGATVAIDAYSWLHKGAFSCAEKLVKGEKTDGYVFYCAKLLNMLLDVGVKPIMVFDGSNLPSKEMTEKKRRENREKTRQRGKELLCEGRVKEARECFQRCVDVTPEMAREVIQMCKKKNIDCIVAPYEADAQLAYLDKIGMAQIIITEDSDLVLFGCSKILFKMDSCGAGLLYEKENLSNSLGSNASKFSFEKFRYMCILSGCDYLSSLPGIGLAKAFKFFMLTRNPDLITVLKKLPSYLKMPKLEVSHEYIDSFLKANNTFLYQLVFCPKKKGLVPLNTYPEGVNASDMEYAGKYLPDDIAVELAMGNINVKTLEKFDDTVNKDSSYDLDKSVVWGTAVVKPVKTVESAFKFNSHKVKPVKRKVELIDTVISDKGPRVSEEDEKLFLMYQSIDFQKDEDLFSMQHSIDSQKDVLEEDPLADVFQKKPKLSVSLPVESESDYEVPKIPAKCSKLPLKRIVKSKFFVASSEKLKSPEVLRENSPEKLSNKDQNLASILDETSDADIKKENVIHSPVKLNKENIIHRFAKKKVEPKSTVSLSSEDITASLQKVEHSWIDVIDTESPITTSSSITSCKFFDQDKNMNSSSANCDSSTLKVKKIKLISTKILDFKWKNESSLKQKLNSSLQSDRNSTNESVIESDVEEVLDSSNNDSSFDLIAKDTDNNVPKDAVVCIDCDDLPSSNSSVDSVSTDLLCSQGSSSSKTVILKRPSTSSANKSGKCRQIGLSKKSKTPNKKIALQDTLLKFHFVRKPKSEVPVTT